MNTTRINFSEWRRRVLGWDGLLPLCVTFLPLAIDFFLPKNTAAQNVAAVAIPIVAIFVRFSIGSAHIAVNRVGPTLRAAQYCVFNVAIFWLCLLECFVIIVNVVDAPAGSAEAAEDWLIVSVMYLPYLLAMSFVMFPGRTETIPEGTF